MNVLSLFSGIGGLDLGLEALGATTVAYSEIEPYAASVMDARFLNAVNVGDITQLTFERNPDGTCYIENTGTGTGWWLPPVDVICGGFPCQDISLAGRGKGIQEGTRSGLWADYARAIRDLRPRGVLVENVAALRGRGLDRVLGDLATLGYDAEWDCIPAAAVGAPHLRDRIFLVAYRTDAAQDVDAFWHGADTYSDRRLELPPLVSGAQEGVDVESGHDAPGLRGSDERREGAGGRPAADAAPVQREAVERAEPHGDDGRARGARGTAANADGELGGSERRSGAAGGTEPRTRSEAARARIAAAQAGGIGAPADADGAGRGEHGWPRPAPEELATAQRRRDVPDFGWVADDADGGGHPIPIAEVRARWDSAQYTGWWSTEPGVGRVAHGVPSRVDRLRCLGNAVVPAAAEHVARILVDRMEQYA